MLYDFAQDVVLPKALHHFHEQLARELLERLRFLKKHFRHAFVSPTFPLLDELRAQMNLESCHVVHQPITYDLMIVWAHPLLPSSTANLSSLLKCLSDDGFFSVTFWGHETLKEIKLALIRAELELTGQAYQRIPSFLRLSEAVPIFKNKGFQDIVADRSLYHILYESLYQALRDLQEITIKADDNIPHLSRAQLEAAQKHWLALTAGHKTVSLDWSWISGWSPLAATKKSLAPGSASVSLRDVL